MAAPILYLAIALKCTICLIDCPYNLYPLVVHIRLLSLVPHPGVKIIGGYREQTREEFGIFIKRVLPGGLAAQDGTLLLYVDK